MVESTGFGEMTYMMPPRMDFLSSPGSGRYIEMQAGVAPTQSQTFTLGSNDALEWTETISALKWMHRKFRVNTQMLLKLSMKLLSLNVI